MSGLDSYKPGLAMVGLQFIYAALNLLTRAAFVQGLSPKVFVVYRLGIASIVMAPLAYISRRRDPSPLQLKSFGWMFLASLVGVTANQSAYFEGVDLSSATMASTMTNLIPAITFIMAFIAGWEKINVRNLGSIAKIVGTVVCVTGAVSMVLLKGPKLLNTQLIPHIKSVLLGSGDHQDNTFLLGSLLLFCSSWFWSSWIILQVPISKTCPDHSFSTAWVCFLATVQSAAIALGAEPATGAWKLNSYLEWGCCLYGGVAQALTFFVQSWCITKRGPVFCAMFNPLCTVIVTIVAAIFLKEEIYIGSMIGACAVIFGLYIVLWGKAKDVKEIREATDPTTVVQVLIEEPSEKKKCINDLEEPLLSADKSTV